MSLPLVSCWRTIRYGFEPKHLENADYRRGIVSNRNALKVFLHNYEFQSANGFFWSLKTRCKFCFEQLTHNRYSTHRTGIRPNYAIFKTLRELFYARLHKGKIPEATVSTCSFWPAIKVHSERLVNFFRLVCDTRSNKKENGLFQKYGV